MKMDKESFKFFGTVYHQIEGITQEYLLTEEAYLVGELDSEFLKFQAVALDSNYDKFMVRWYLYNIPNQELDDYNFSIASEIRYL
jgi:hypothetical protein